MDQDDNQLRFLFVDLETGGLEPTENPLLEIGMRCEYGENDPDAVEFSAIIQQSAEDWAKCTEGALNVNQFTYDEVMLDGLPLDIVATMLCEWLDANNITAENVIWVGQNPSFDERFISHYLGSYLEFVGLLPLHNVINVMNLAKELKRYSSTFKPSSLSGANISLALGIQPEDNVHRALGGVDAVRRNFYQLQKLLSGYTKKQGVKA